jgi:hypothetical protein
MTNNEDASQNRRSDQQHTTDDPPILIEEEEATRGGGELIPWSFLHIYCRYHVPRTQEEKENLELILEWMRSRGYGSKTNTYQYNNWLARGGDATDILNESNQKRGLGNHNGKEQRFYS